MLVNCKKNELDKYVVSPASLENTSKFWADSIKIIFMQPSGEKLDSLLNVTDKDKLAQTISTAMYYNDKFKEYLSKKNLEYTESNKRFVCFRKNDGDTLCFDTKHIPLDWYLLLFDGINTPTYISNVSVPED
jgi:hypothetical protein